MDLPDIPGERSAGEGAWCVYLVRCADGSLYCGITTDLARRIAMHNGDLPGGAKYTRPRRPVRLAAHACGLSRSTALRLERLVKKQPAAKKVLYLLSKRRGTAEGDDSMG
ncbi:MAG: GIY-YIG nuclease family protein [Mailhella sp.]|nr:GIY-YIG nuclease family protein [Mailhella sp.]